MANNKDNMKLTSQFKRLADVWLCRHFSDPACPLCFPPPLIEGPIAPPGLGPKAIVPPFPKVKKEASFFNTFTLPSEVLNSNRGPNGMANAIMAVISNLLVKKKEEEVEVKEEEEQQSNTLLQSPTSASAVPKGTGPLASASSTDSCSCPLPHRRDALMCFIRKVDEYCRLRGYLKYWISMAMMEGMDMARWFFQTFRPPMIEGGSKCLETELRSELGRLAMIESITGRGGAISDVLEAIVWLLFSPLQMEGRQTLSSSAGSPAAALQILKNHTQNEPRCKELFQSMMKLCNENDTYANTVRLVLHSAYVNQLDIKDPAETNDHDTHNNDNNDDEDDDDDKKDEGYYSLFSLVLRTLFRASGFASYTDAKMECLESLFSMTTMLKLNKDPPPPPPPMKDENITTTTTQPFFSERFENRGVYNYDGDLTQSYYADLVSFNNRPPFYTDYNLGGFFTSKDMADDIMNGLDVMKKTFDLNLHILDALSEETFEEVLFDSCPTPKELLNIWFIYSGDYCKCAPLSLLYRRFRCDGNRPERPLSAWCWLDLLKKAVMVDAAMDIVPAERSTCFPYKIMFLTIKKKYESPQRKISMPPPLQAVSFKEEVALNFWVQSMRGKSVTQMKRIFNAIHRAKSNFIERNGKTMVESVIQTYDKFHQLFFPSSSSSGAPKFVIPTFEGANSLRELIAQCYANENVRPLSWLKERGVNITIHDKDGVSLL